MPSIRDLRKRITTVKNTQQTTRAMKMVSAAKLRRAQEAILSHRPYAREVGSLIRLVSSLSDFQYFSPLIRREAGAIETGETTTTSGKTRILLIVVSSDRGLCGGFNSSIIKKTQRWINENQSSKEISLAFIGRKAAEYFKRRGFNEKYYAEFGNKATFDAAKKVVEWATSEYLGGNYDEIHFTYNEFKNAISQEVIVERFLPVLESEFNVDTGKVDTKKTAGPPAELYVLKPDPKALLDALLKKHFATQAFRVLLESQASEHGARMSAMENATKNAGDMIRKLTLLYNKQRQAGITKELLEIISGSESQKG